MKESTKKTFKDLGIILISLGAFAFIAIAVPEGSFFKNLFAYICLLALVVGIIYFNGLWTPIKSFFLKIFNKK